jgi:hypothetical protein
MNILTVCINIFMSQALTLVSDLRTPCFLIDIDMLGKASRLVSAESCHSNPSTTSHITSIYLPKYDIEFIPHSMQSTVAGAVDDSCCFYSVDEYHDFQSALGYIHASVSNPRPQDGGGSFLAELDLPYDQRFKGRLVLGINNHHVGSYYWARSAGMGASMEAPGISFRSSSSNLSSLEAIHGGILCWEGNQGPRDCNSNDGKRSEWVNFLRKGDTIQLLPECFQECLMEFWIRSEAAMGSVDATSSNFDRYGIYGFSSQGRPLGSEPIVTCKWEINKTNK